MKYLYGCPYLSPFNNPYDLLFIYFSNFFRLYSYSYTIPHLLTWSEYDTFLLWKSRVDLVANGLLNHWFLNKIGYNLFENITTNNSYQ